MATFHAAPVRWPGSDGVHLSTDSVWERAAKFTDCGERIGPDAVYDGERTGQSITTFVPLVPTCPRCLRRAPLIAAAAVAVEIIDPDELEEYARRHPQGV